MSDRGRTWILAAVVLAGAMLYATPLFLPPAATPPEAANADGISLLARMFPGWPPALQLARLVGAMVAVVTAVRLLPATPTPPREAPVPCRPPARSRLLAACAWSLVQLALFAFLAHRRAFAPEMDTMAAWLPTAWFAGLLVPILLLGRGCPVPRLPRVAGAGVALLIVAWTVWRLVVGVEGIRTAEIVDLWPGLDWLRAAVVDGRNVLFDLGQPGLPSTYMLFVGLPVFAALGQAPSLAAAQVVHLAWLALDAWMLGRLLGRRWGGAAALVGVAVFLFSPFVLTLSLSPSPYGVFVCFVIAALTLLERLGRNACPVTLVALATVAGVATMSAHLLPLLAVGGLGVAAWLARREPATPPLVWASAALAFFAAAAPHLPGPTALAEMSEAYVDARASWPVVERVVQGQRSLFEPPGPDFLWKTGEWRPLDVALGALVSPLAVTRTPLRLWGDTLFDPLGALLALIGAFVGLKRITRDPSAGGGALAARGGSFAGRVDAAPALLLLLSLAPAALASAFDRASVTRNLASPVAMAICAAAGAHALAAAPGVARLGRSLAPLLVLAIALPSAWLYDVVNPRILTSSWLAIAIEAITPARPAGRIVVADHGGLYRMPFLHAEGIAHGVATPPFDHWLFDGDLGTVEEGGEPALLILSPALEKDANLLGRVCTRWPAARVFTLVDRSGFSKVLVAAMDGSAWSPALPQERWSGRDCAPPVDAGRTP